MDSLGVGESSVGVFATTASGGRAFNGRRFHKGKGRKGALDRFADELARHIDQADLDAGRVLATGQPLPADQLDPGGDVQRAARRAGCKSQQGNAMLQRIRKKLGPQAV